MSDHKTKSAESHKLTDGIVTSDAVAKASGRKLLRLPRISAKGALIALVVLGALAAAGYGGYLWLGKHTRQAQIQPEVVKSPRAKVDELSSRLSAAGNSEAALQAAQDELERLEKGATSPIDKEIYSLASANLYRQANKLDDALAQAKKAEATYKTAISAATLAEVYRAQGDLANAAKYYGIASERSPKTAPTVRSDYNDYRLMKEEVEAQL